MLTSSKAQRAKNTSESSVIIGNLSRISNKENCSEEINEMISRLREYEGLCIQKEDYGLAEEAKKKIEVLRDQQVYVRQETIAVMEKEHVRVVLCRLVVSARRGRRRLSAFRSFGIWRCKG